MRLGIDAQDYFHRPHDVCLRDPRTSSVERSGTPSVLLQTVLVLRLAAIRGHKGGA